MNNKSCQQELLGAIAHTWLSVKQKAKNTLKYMNYDLTFEQMMVLHILDDYEGLNLGDVADKADRERTTISRMVDGLEKRNLVIRVPDKIDKRQKLLYLTNFGKERIAQMDPLQKEFHRLIYRDIDEKEIENCIKTLTKIIDNIQKK